MGWSDEPSKDFKEWKDQMDGCIQCACDHGCNQWLENNQTKAALVIKILSEGGNTSLDKLVSMENKRVDRIYVFISWRESVKYNEELRKKGKDV